MKSNYGSLKKIHFYFASIEDFCSLSINFLNIICFDKSQK